MHPIKAPPAPQKRGLRASPIPQGLVLEAYAQVQSEASAERDDWWADIDL